MENDFQKNNNAAPQAPINNIPPSPFLSKRKTLVIAFFILFIIIDAGLLLVWMNKKEATRPQPKINKYCQNRDEVVRTMNDPVELEGLVLNILNDEEISNVYSQVTINDFFVRYLGCGIIQSTDESHKKELQELGMNFIEKDKNVFKIVNKYNKDIEELHRYYLNMAVSGKLVKRTEYKNIQSNQIFEELLYNFEKSLPETCPYLSEKCNERMAAYSLPEDFCNTLCEKILEYENNYDLLFDEMVVNEYKGWENGSLISSNMPILRYLLLYRLYGEDTAAKICDYVPAEEQEMCQVNIRIAKVRINNFRRDVYNCDNISAKITDFICNDL